MDRRPDPEKILPADAIANSTWLVPPWMAGAPAAGAGGEVSGAIHCARGFQGQVALSIAGIALILPWRP